MTDPIHVALASDNNYFDGLLVTSWSIAKSCRSPNCLIFHILDGGISTDNWAFLQSKLASLRCKIDRITINDATDLHGLTPWHGAGRMAYARLLLEVLLPTVSHIIYSDVDIVWLADITELWKKRSSDISLHYVPILDRQTAGETKEESQWAIDIGMPFVKGKYFCSGMILMNLDRFRAESLSNKALSLLRSNYQPCLYADQSALNALFAKRNDAIELPQFWQARTNAPSSFTSSEHLVIHYANDAPWKSIHSVHHLITDLHIMWHRIHASLYDCSTWKSLRQYNSTATIITCRLLFILASKFTFVKSLLHIYMRMNGKTSQLINNFLTRHKLPDYSYMLI